MEQVTPAPLAYVSVDESAFAFSGEGLVEFAARPRGRALVDECFLVVDVYAADDHSHPGGHAGWWECRLGGRESVAVSVGRSDGRLDVRFNGAPAENYWINAAFQAEGRALTMHLVVRAWRSTTILFDDALPLYADAAALEADLARPFHRAVPAEIPPRWFVWPPATKVLLAFDSLRSAGAVDLCGQLASLLAAGGIPHEIYAWHYTPAQRRHIRPAQYLRHAALRDDIVFFAFSGGNFLFPLVAELACKKIIYHRQLPDYRRFQAFDAELARNLSETDAFTEMLPAFDGICYESEHTRKSVAAAFESVAGECLEEAWQKADAPPVKTSETPSSLDIDGPVFTEEPMFCSLPENGQPWLPRYLRLTRTQASLPPDLGVFPPALWAKRWEGLAEEACQVPDPFILSVGSFRPDKRHEDALRIFAAVAERHPSIGLVIAGWPSTKGYWDYLRYLREDVHVAHSSRIVFQQNCTEGQLLYLYRRAALFLSAGSYEGYSGSLVEALEFGLPVVARQTCAVRDTLGFSSLQYDASTPPEAVAEDILKICADRQAFPAARAVKTEREARPAQKALEALYRVALMEPRSTGRTNGRRKA